GGDSATAPTKDPDITRAMLLQEIDDFGEELDMPTVVARNADGPGVLLDRSPRDLEGRTVITEVNDFYAVPDEFQIDGIDGTVMAVANRHGGENADWQARCAMLHA